MKKVLLLMLILVVFIASCQKNASKSTIEYQNCTLSSDCMIVQESCNSCSCDNLINKRYAENYVESFYERCGRYLDDCPAAECDTAKIKCIDNKCTYVKDAVGEDQIDVCELDSDCIIVPYDHCCGMTKRAINRQYKKLYDATPEWQVFDDPQTCAAIGLCSDDSSVNETKCDDTEFGRKCVLVY